MRSAGVTAAEMDGSVQMNSNRQGSWKASILPQLRHYPWRRLFWDWEVPSQSGPSPSVEDVRRCERRNQRRCGRRCEDTWEEDAKEGHTRRYRRHVEGDTGDGAEGPSWKKLNSAGEVLWRRGRGSCDPWVTWNRAGTPLRCHSHGWPMPEEGHLWGTATCGGPRLEQRWTKRKHQGKEGKRNKEQQQELTLPTQPLAPRITSPKELAGTDCNGWPKQEEGRSVEVWGWEMCWSEIEPGELGSSSLPKCLIVIFVFWCLLQ